MIAATEAEDEDNDHMEHFKVVAPYLTHPLVLVGFVLLLVFGTHRALLNSSLLKPLSTASSGIVVRLVLHYGFVIAVLLILFGFGLAFWREHEERSKQPLDRLSAETLVQRNRGNIEHCIRDLTTTLYLDFVFTTPPGSELNLDIVSGDQVDQFDTHPEHLPDGVMPATSVPSNSWPSNELLKKYREGATAFVTGTHPAHPHVAIAAPSGKLAIINPDANGCLIAALLPSLEDFHGIKPGPQLVHRYITEAGVRASRMYSGFVGPYIVSALYDRDFALARTLVTDAIAQGYGISADAIETAIGRVERAATELRTGLITEEQWKLVYNEASEAIYSETEKLTQDHSRMH